MNPIKRLIPIAIAALVLTSCRDRIQHGLDEAQANEIQTVLLELGFAAKKVPEGGKKPTWAIEVDDDHALSATRVLSELGLPRQSLASAPDVGLVPTPTQERAAQLNALANELSGTLETIAGVTVARVHLVVPAPPRPGQAPGRAKASAFLRVRPGQGANVRGMDEELRRLMAGSVEGLLPEDVTLVVNEVVSSVPPPVQGTHPTQRLRVVLVGMGMLVSFLAILLIVAAVRMRSLQARAAHTVQPPTAVPTRPTINAANARKAA